MEHLFCGTLTNRGTHCIWMNPTDVLGCSSKHKGQQGEKTEVFLERSPLDSWSWWIWKIDSQGNSVARCSSNFFLLGKGSRVFKYYLSAINWEHFWMQKQNFKRLIIHLDEQSFPNSELQKSGEIIEWCCQEWTLRNMVQKKQNDGLNSGDK